MKVSKKISFSKNARESPIARITFPTGWLSQMAVTSDNNRVIVEFTGNEIIIKGENQYYEEKRS